MTQNRDATPSEEPFHQRLTGAQSSLYAFICSLLGGGANAGDVLQETNLMLWEKAEQFDRSRDFLPWAFQFAHMQVLAHRKRQKRDRLLFDDDLVQTLATEFAEKNMANFDARRDSLDQCIQKLPDAHRNLVRQFYEQGRTIAQVSDACGKSVAAVTATLYRIRKSLLQCIQHALRKEGIR